MKRITKVPVHTEEQLRSFFPWFTDMAVECVYRFQFLGNASNLILNSSIQVYPIVAQGKLVYPNKELDKIVKLHKFTKSQNKRFYDALLGVTRIKEGFFWNDVLNAFEWATKKKPFMWD